MNTNYLSQDSNSPRDALSSFYRADSDSDDDVDIAYRLSERGSQRLQTALSVTCSSMRIRTIFCIEFGRTLSSNTSMTPLSLEQIDKKYTNCDNFGEAFGYPPQRNKQLTYETSPTSFMQTEYGYDDDENSESDHGRKYREGGQHGREVKDVIYLVSRDDPRNENLADTLARNLEKLSLVESRDNVDSPSSTCQEERSGGSSRDNSVETSYTPPLGTISQEMEYFQFEEEDIDKESTQTKHSDSQRDNTADDGSIWSDGSTSDEDDAQKTTQATEDGLIYLREEEYEEGSNISSRGTWMEYLATIDNRSSAISDEETYQGKVSDNDSVNTMDTHGAMKDMKASQDMRQEHSDETMESSAAIRTSDQGKEEYDAVDGFDNASSRWQKQGTLTAIDRQDTQTRMETNQQWKANCLIEDWAQFKNMLQPVPLTASKTTDKPIEESSASSVYVTEEQSRTIESIYDHSPLGKRTGEVMWNQKLRPQESEDQKPARKTRRLVLHDRTQQFIQRYLDSFSQTSRFCDKNILRALLAGISEIIPAIKLRAAHRWQISE